MKGRLPMFGIVFGLQGSKKLKTCVRGGFLKPESIEQASFPGSSLCVIKFTCKSALKSGIKHLNAQPLSISK